MAYTQPIKDKTGKVVSYRIKVFRGRDAEGKQLKPYSMNWKIPETYKSEKAILKALEKVAGEFETNCKKGEVSIDNRTFNEYADYYLQLREKDFKPTTRNFYKRMLPIIKDEFVGIKLNQISAEHLNRFYLKLQTGDVKQNKKAKAKDNLLTMKKELKVKSKTLQEQTGLSDNTIRNCFKQENIAIESAEKVATFFGKKMSDLFDLVSFGEGYAPKYINHFHSFIHAILQQALKEGCVNRNVAEMSTPPKNPKHEAEFFELEQIMTIKDALELEPTKYRIATYLLIDTGIRRGELIGIRWKSIDFENCTIRIENNVVYTEDTGLVSNTPKNGECRTVNIAPALIPILKAYKKEQSFFTKVKFSSIGDDIERQKAIRNFNPEGYLFIQDSGKVMTPNAINQWMLTLSKKLGFRIHPHKFRHSQASILYAEGVDVVTISKRLGHKQVSTTQNIYAHLMEKSDKEASDKIAGLLFGTGN